MPATGQHDLVLMRHVLIYFRPLDRRRALDRAAGLCRKGGLLVLGASEGGELSGDDRFEVVLEGLPVFRKIDVSKRSHPTPKPREEMQARPKIQSEPLVFLDEDGVTGLLRPYLSAEPGGAVTIDLRSTDSVIPDAAWSLGRGLRLLALRGTFVSVLSPTADAPRRTLKASLVWELARNGLIRWEEP